MYGNGQGVPQDYILSHMWLNLSISNGKEGGVINRNIIEKVMTPSQIAEAEKLAREWIEKHGNE